MANHKTHHRKAKRSHPWKRPENGFAKMPASIEYLRNLFGSKERLSDYIQKVRIG